MKWVIFTGTWKLTNAEVERDVREATRKVLSDGDAIITGGATGVDYFCMDECYKLKSLNKLRVILPTKLDFYIQHYHTAYEAGKIDLEACDNLCDILTKIQKESPVSVLEMHHKTLTQDEYNERNSEEVKYGDEIYAFQVNNSSGTQDTIDKAGLRGVPTTLHKKYTI